MSLTATPNPAIATRDVVYSAAVSVSGEPTGTMDFGDGSTEILGGDAIKTGLKEGISHTYAADGVYLAKLSVSSGGASSQTQLYVIVGKGTQVDPGDGMVTNGSFDATGLLTLTLDVSRLVGATSALTEFSDSLGRQAPYEGLLLMRRFELPGISVAHSRAIDATGVQKGHVRKTLAVSAHFTGDSSALPDPASTTIKTKKLSGKFIFTKAKPDKVDFQGEIALPQGFNPAKGGGNKLHIAVGNVFDSVIVDDKGKAVLPGEQGRLTKAKVSYPKMNGTATGGEIAKLAVTLSLTDMVAAGFDTEGITPNVRADEKGLKSMSRAIQVAIVLDGVAYETLAAVTFKVSSNGSAGQMQSRRPQ